MAVDPRKRQQKLERRKAKQKAQKREKARVASAGMAGKLDRVAKAPVLHCVVTEGVFRAGIGEVVLSRELHDGQVAFGAFLIDCYCLGVKNAFGNIVPRLQYQERIFDPLDEHGPVRPITPEFARKLVEGAVQYALELGFSPHPDYRVARHIFGDIDAGASRESFTFGKDGKPLYVAGPYEDRNRCEMILHTLEAHCGPDGYHYIVPV
jgi:hypothetical protein